MNPITITITRKRLTWAALAAVLAVIALVAAGCAKFTEPFKDAPTSGHNGSAAQVIEQPDGFSNMAEKCDGYGHLVVSVYHGGSPYGSVAIITDARCGSLRAPLPFAPDGIG